MADELKISVLTVCRNAAATIRHTLDSFFAQSHWNKELILVDGASTDDTLAIVRTYSSEMLRVISEPDHGMYDALNKALRIFTGNAMGVLNADDAFHDETVLSRVAVGLASSDIVHGHLDFVKDQIGKQVVRRWRAEQRPAKGFRSGWMPAHPTFYVRRSVAERVGPFNSEMRVAADYDWMLQALELHRFSSTVIDHVLVDMLQGGASTSGLRAHVGHNLEALRSRRQWLGSGTFDYALIAKPARKLSQFLGR